MATPRAQTQLSMLGYLSGQPRAAISQVAPARSAVAQHTEHSAERSAERGRTGRAAGAKQRKGAQGAMRQQAGRKKRTQTSLDEEAIDETDHEQEPEEEADSDDRDFISDGEQDATGAEQRAMERELECEHDSGTEFEQFQEAMATAAHPRRRKRARELEDESMKKRERSKQRDLQVLAERGRGDTRRSVAQYPEKAPFCLPSGSFVTPWDKQSERSVLDFGNERGRLAEGAFHSDAHARWMNSDEAQADFAERFSVPVSESYALKAVSTDVPRTPLDPRRCLTNATTKVLQCVRTTHAQTELDLMDGKHYEKVYLGLQRTGREHRQAMDGGPNGGLQGCAVDVLWLVNSGEEVGNISDTMLRLVDILTMAKQGSKGDELFHMTTTDRVEWFSKGKTGLTKVQCGVQTKRAYNFQEAAQKSAYCAVQDLDARLLRKVWTHRHPDRDFDDVKNDWPTLSAIVHGRHQVNNPELMGDDIRLEEQFSTDLNTMQIFLYKDVLPAWDAVQKQTTTVSIEGIYLMATSPANDPLVFLRSIAENNPAASVLLADVFRHMRSVLGQETCTWDQLFGTDRAGAAECTPESRMVEGFFRFCHAKSLFNVQLGGMRMDVADPAEMHAWRRYVEQVAQARKAHYRLLLKETLHDRAHWREAHLPVLNNSSWLDFYHGHMYWRVSNRQVEQEIDDYIHVHVLPECEQEVREQLRDWHRSRMQSRDGQSVFIAEGEGWVRNSGLWIKIRTDNSKSADDEKELAKGKRADDSFPRWAQPHQECRLVKIWLANAKDRAAGQDPLDVVLHNSKWIPDIEWMKHTMPTLDEQHESIQWLFELIGDYALAATHRKVHSNCNPRTLEILHLVGKERNAMHKSIATVLDSCRLSVLFRTWMQKLNTSIKNALVQMRGCELLAWKLSALSVNDLKKQNNLKDKWADAFCHASELEQNVQASEDWQSLLCAATWPSLFLISSFERLDADLCYMNQMLMWNFICCTMAHNENRRGAYGMSLRIIDMAGTVDLLKEADGKMAGRTTVVKVTEKSPGAGADTTVSFVMQMFVMAMSHISLTQEVKDLANTARDTMHKQVSKMSYALFQGSGVLVNSKREIMSSTFQTEISNNGHFTELFKNDDDQLAWIESLMAHSGDVQVGAESGVAQAAWSTTMNLENMSVERLKPIPVIVLTGNRPAHSTPASAVEGGRWMHVASSTQDKENGFYIVHKSTQAHNALKHSLPVRFALNTLTENEQNTSLRVMQKSKCARLSNQLSTDNVRLNIKIITREDVYNNMIFFLLMQWLRKDAALLLSTLTHEAQNYTYSLKFTLSRIECAVGQLTRGLRRDFLESNPDYWHRNAMGPWAKVIQISMHVMLSMTSAILTGLSRTHEGWPLDLHMSFVSGIRSLMTNTISFTAVLASLHLWLATAVLDYNFMILCCYVYHFTAFQHSCSLRVLSLVMRGCELEDEEFEQYLRFCNHLAPCVLEASVLAERSDFGPRNVAHGVLQMPSHSTLADWYTYHMPALHSDLNKAHAARTQGTAQERLSVYCQPRLSFVHRETIKGFGRPREGNAPAPDSNVSGTPSRVLGTSVGAAQKLAEHQKRVDKGACIDGRIDGRSKMQEWENTTEFWKRVRKGTLLPEASTATNDMHKIKFEYVPYTGLWWDQTITNAEPCDGLLQSFLLQSDLDTDITVHGFFERLLAPFLAHEQRDERVYGGPHAPRGHANAWATPVLSALRPFQFACAPYIDAQHLPQGVNVNVCMSLVHYVVVQGLGVTRDWSCAAHDNSKFVSCVHLRNTSHMTLGLLSLFMHTCCEKAMIPANNGLLRLPLPSPVFNTQMEAAVEYDSRLHIDSTLHINGGKSDNMLSIDSRLAKKENWRVLSFHDGRCALGYASVYSDLAQHPTTARHFFPFPPEAVAHAADMYKYMTLAHRRFTEVLEKEELDVAADENHFALAMLSLGNSIRFEEHSHVKPSLTECVVRGAREVPCVSCQHAFLFVLTFAEGMMHVRPVAPTFDWNAAHVLAGDTPPFQMLPAEEAALPAAAFAKFFRHGLKMAPVSAGDEPRVVVDIAYSEEKRLPFYMFPVMHWPVLVKMRHDGWTMQVPADFDDFQDDDLLLHGCDFFYSNTCRTYHVRSMEEDGAWLRQHCPALVAELTPELTDVEAYFHNSQTTSLLGVWARVTGVRVHFDSLEHLRADVRRGINVSRFVSLTQDAQQHYMLEHNVWGATPVLKQDNGKYSASFSYFVDASEDKRFLVETQAKLALAREQNDTAGIAAHTETIADLQAHMLSSPPMTELFRDVHFSFNDFTPNMIPLHQGQQQGDAMWGLTVEQDAAFIRNGCYHVSAAGKAAQAGEESTELVHCLLDMDFVSMSRCMVPEGTELWIRVTAEVYAIILQQAQDQGSSLMLPVSHTLHNGMPVGLSRYLRAFYVLGGSMHDKQLADNQVSLVCVIASKNSVPGKKTTADDAADARSRVNQNISVDNTRFVAISLPILLHGAAVFDHTRDPALPFYKYLKEKPVARQR